MQTNSIAPTTEIPAAQRNVEARRAMIAAIEQELAHASEDGQAMLYYRLGCLALALGDVRQRAMDAFSQMRELAVSQGELPTEGLAQVGLAVVFDLLGFRHEALGAALRAERIAIAGDDLHLLALALNQQGQFYKETGDNPRALTLFGRVHAIGVALEDRRLVMGGLIGMGRTTPMAAPDEAIAFYEQAIRLAEELGDDEALSLCYNNLADWRIATGQYAEAIRLRDESLRLSQGTGNREGIGRALIGIGKAYTLLDDEPRAWEFLNRGLPVVVGVGDMEGELHVSLNLAHLYVRRGDVPRAVEYYQRTLEKSLAAPDAACAAFAQRALDQLAAGAVPQPAILPPVLLTPENSAVLANVRPIYQTGDMFWSGLPTN